MTTRKCSVCGLVNYVVYNDLSWYCAECCNLLMKGVRHNDYPEAIRDAQERCDAWAIQNREEM